MSKPKRKASRVQTARQSPPSAKSKAVLSRLGENIVNNPLGILNAALTIIKMLVDSQKA